MENIGDFNEMFTFHDKNILMELLFSPVIFIYHIKVSEYTKSKLIKEKMIEVEEELGDFKTWLVVFLSQMRL